MHYADVKMSRKGRHFSLTNSIDVYCTTDVSSSLFSDNSVYPSLTKSTSNQVETLSRRKELVAISDSARSGLSETIFLESFIRQIIEIVC